MGRMERCLVNFNKNSSAINPESPSDVQNETTIVLSSIINQEIQGEEQAYTVKKRTSAVCHYLFIELMLIRCIASTSGVRRNRKITVNDLDASSDRPSSSTIAK